MNQEFNENPFMATTPVLVFSNGTDADEWFSHNCSQCVKQYKCGLKRSMLESTNNCYCIIQLHIAKRIGIKYDPLYQQGSLYLSCKEKKTGDEPF